MSGLPGSDAEQSERPLRISLPPAPSILSFAPPNPSPQHQSPSVTHPPPTHSEAPLSPHLDDAYPEPTSPPPQLPFDDEALSTLEKIYLFSRSKATHHRVYIAHALPGFLDQVSPREAIDYVLPLLSALAMDDDEQVKEALVSELVRIIWWFYSHCKLVADELAAPVDSVDPHPPTPYSAHMSLPPDSPLQTPSPTSHSPRSAPASQSQYNSPLHPHPPHLDLSSATPYLYDHHPRPHSLPATPVYLGLSPRSAHSPFPSSMSNVEQDPAPAISVQAFTPILGTLLLSPTGMVGGMARYAVVDLLRRMKNASRREDPRQWRKHRRKSVSEDFHPPPESKDPGLDFYIDSKMDLDLFEESPTTDGDESEGDDIYTDCGLFGPKEREMLEHEILWQVVIGLGKLDEDPTGMPEGSATDFAWDSAGSHSEGDDSDYSHLSNGGEYNPYFPPIPSTSRSPSLGSSSALSTPPRTITPTQNSTQTFNWSPPSVLLPPPVVSPTSSNSVTTPPSATINPGPRSPIPIPYSIYPLVALYPPLSSPNNLLPNREDYASVHARSPRHPPTAERPRGDNPAPLTQHLLEAFSDRAAVSATRRGPPSYSSPGFLSTPVWAQLSSSPRHSPRSSPVYERPPRTVSPMSPPSFQAQTSRPLRLNEYHVDPSQLPSELSPFPESTASSLNAETEPESELEQQASVGRLSSMSLVAAVTASHCLSHPVIDAFIEEVQRVAADPIYWVRREVCFALGALAKSELVSIELVIDVLIPLLKTLLKDPAAHVRHSGLFALPAILLRLGRGNSEQRAMRKALIMDTIIPLASDVSRDVRTGVLEALGEVLFAFYDGGRIRRWKTFEEFEPPSEAPPGELVEMLLGRRKEDGKVRHGQQPDTSQENGDIFRIREVRSPTPYFTYSLSNPRSPPVFQSDKEHALKDFYDDPSRSLICAFNFPALTLVLGPSKWDSTLREPYLQLSRSEDIAIRRTLAASIGAMARILGQSIADRDLVDVWKRLFCLADIENRLAEEDVLERIVDSLGTFTSCLGPRGRLEVVQELSDLLLAGRFRGWRVREGIADRLSSLTQLASADSYGQEMSEIAIWSALRCIIKCSLLDRVNCVREAAISSLPQIWSVLQEQPKALEGVREDIMALSRDQVFRRRMTFVACQHALIVPRSDGKSALAHTDELWESLRGVAKDSIEGVRIGVSRLIGSVCRHYIERGSPISGILLELAQRLKEDISCNVSAYIPGLPDKSQARQDASDFLVNFEMQEPSPVDGHVPLTTPPSRSLYRADSCTFSRPPVLDTPSITGLPSRGLLLEPNPYDAMDVPETPMASAHASGPTKFISDLAPVIPDLNGGLFGSLSLTGSSDLETCGMPSHVQAFCDESDGSGSEHPEDRHLREQQQRQSKVMSIQNTMELPTLPQSKIRDVGYPDGLVPV